MRNMSFFETQEQIRNRSKTVTRRMGWLDLKVGELLQPVVKGQGLKKGEKVEKIGGPIEVLSVRRERLYCIAGELEEVAREGFPGMQPIEFVKMFKKINKCHTGDMITRIEFTYLDRVRGL